MKRVVIARSWRQRGAHVVEVLLLLVTSLLIGISTASGASAEVLDYPDASVPCAHAPFATTGTGYWCKNYDWGYTREDKYGVVTQSTTYSSRGYGYRNCTDFVAWKLQSLGVPDAKTWGLGNGGNWADNAASKGLQWSATPAVGDAAVQQSTSSTDYGHVAYVSSASTDGSGNITVQEYNRNKDGAGGTRTGTPSVLGFTKFVHFASLMTNPPTSTLPSAASTKPISALIDGNGNQHTFVTTSGGLNHYVKYATGSLTGEVIASGTFTSGPSSYRTADGNLHVVLTTSGGLNHYVRYTNGAWGGENVVASTAFTNAPSAFVDSAGNQQVMVTTTGGLERYVKYASGGGWHGEGVVGDKFTSAPSAYASPDGTFHVFVLTAGGLNHYVRYTNGAWGGENVAPGSFTNAPSAFVDKANNQHVYVTTSGGLNHYVKYASGGGWVGEAITT